MHSSVHMLYLYKIVYKKEKNTNREKERLNLDESKKNVFKQDRLNRFRHEKAGKFVRCLCSFLLASVFESRCEVKVGCGGFGRRYEIVVLKSERVNGPGFCSKVSRYG